MKFLFTAMLFLATTAVAFSQTTTYYKDEALTKKVTEKKAKFKTVETGPENGITTVKKYAVNENRLLSESGYKDGKPAGNWVVYKADGSVLSRRNFDAMVYSTEEEKNLFNNSIPDNNPDNFEKASFPNGENDLFKFMATQIRYPAESVKSGSSGLVILRFIIDENGKAQAHSIYKGVDPFLDYEAWSLIERMPAWIPAKVDGKPVESFYVLPFRFNIR